jgi:formylglycine-generating enzyme required for sulfatase activity
MKHPIITSLGLAVMAGVSLVTPASATISIDYVTVGNAGKAADTRVGTGSLGYGAVGYAYQIGKYEVTNSQYVDFLNAKAVTDTYSLYNPNMSDYGITRANSSGSYNYSVTGGLGNRPVVYVSWFDAARFSNWLGNGQGSGSTETGAYTLTGGQTTGIVTVNAGAKVYIPSENEWYKAAYYNGTTSAYSLYPNGQNTITTADANYASLGSINVGSYSGDPSSYGTFDQGGNVWEWNDAAISGAYRGLRGGSWDGDASLLRSSFRNYSGPSTELNLFGFRVASSELAAVPEPTSLLSTLALVSSGLLLRRRTKNLR